jgi:hypothetical protein
MAYTRSADGIAKKGKTEGKNLGETGPTQKEMMGGKKSAGVTSEAMMKVGRNMARVMNQKRG